MVVISGVYPVVGSVHVEYSNRAGLVLKRAGFAEMRELHEQYIERTARETEEYLRS